MIIDLVQERRARRQQDTRPFADACLSYEERLLKWKQQEAEDQSLLQIVRTGELRRIFVTDTVGADYDRPLTPFTHRTWSTIAGGTAAAPKRTLVQRVKDLVAS